MSKLIVLLPRGEAIRNFVYSGFIEELAKGHKVIIYSVVPLQLSIPQIDVRSFPEEKLGQWHARVRRVLDIGHEYHTNSVRHRYGRKIRFYKANSLGSKIGEYMKHLFGFLCSNRSVLNWLTKLENRLHLRSSSTTYWAKTFHEEKPKWILNTSHIHGFNSELPCKLAKSMHIPVYGFVFSWDNLTTRSRIAIAYDKLFLWHSRMLNNLEKQYGMQHPLRKNAIVTGTPQFDGHHPDNPLISKEDLLNYLGIQNMPASVDLVLYSTAMATDFPQEHYMIGDLIQWFEDDANNTSGKILVIRPYVKGLTPELKSLMNNTYQRVVFMPVMWDEAYFTPQKEDAVYYKAMLKHSSVGINIASTVSLELMIYGTHVINIGFDHPDTDYSPVYKYHQHLEYDHYKEVVNGEGVHVAKSMSDLFHLIQELSESGENQKGKEFMNWFFDGQLSFNATKTILKHVQSP